MAPRQSWVELGGMGGEELHNSWGRGSPGDPRRRRVYLCTRMTGGGVSLFSNLPYRMLRPYMHRVPMSVIARLIAW